MSEIKYIATFLNAKLYTLGDTCNVRTGASTSSEIAYTGNKGIPIGQATGNILFTDQDGSDFWYQLIPQDKFKTTYNYVYARTDVCTFINSTSNNNPVTNSGAILYTGNNGNTLLDTVIKNDKILYKQLLILAKEISNARNNNVDTTQYETVYNQILSEYKTRQDKIATTIGTQIAVSSSLNLIPGGSIFVSLYDEFSKMISGTKFLYGRKNLPYRPKMQGLNAAWLIPVAVSAVVTGLVIYALYEMFKPDYERGKVNIKVSSDLQKALETLPADKRAAVLKDLQSQIDDAYNAGKSSTGIFTYIKYGILIFGTVVGVSKVMDYVKKQKAKRQPKLNKHK